MRLLSSLAIIGLSFAVSSAAQSATLIATFQGKLYSGLDESNFFQTGNTDLAGAAYTAVYRFDTSLGKFTNDNGLLTINGGSSVGVASPGLGMTLTIGGKSMDLDGQYGAFLTSGLLNLGTPAPGFSVDYFETFDDGIHLRSINTFETISTLTGGIPISLGKSFDYDIKSSDQIYSNMEILEIDRDQGKRLNFVQASFSPTHLSVSVSNAGAVPEPGSWALMITGFGICGYSLRKRRSPEREGNQSSSLASLAS